MCLYFSIPKIAFKRKCVEQNASTETSNFLFFHDKYRTKPYSNVVFLFRLANFAEIFEKLKFLKTSLQGNEANLLL